MLDLDMIRKIYAMDFMPGAGFVSFSIDSYGECSVENPLQNLPPRGFTED